MKKLLNVMLAVLVTAQLFGVALWPETAWATLIFEQDGLEKVVYDSNTDTYWLQDLTTFSNLNYAQLVASVQADFAATSYLGISNWHVATFPELAPFQQLFAVSGSGDATEMQAFTPTTQHLLTPQILYSEWSGRFDTQGTSGVPGAHGDLLLQLEESVTSPSTVLFKAAFVDAMYPDAAGGGAWVVGTKSAPVPEPSAIFLVALGIAVAGFVRRWKRGKR